MNQLDYPLMSEDMTKNGGNLYSSEPSMSFVHHTNNKSSSFSQPQQDYNNDQWRSSPSVPLTINSSPINHDISANNPATNPVSCDLQEVIIYYQSQPELLRLILLSKVEEDKRRSEEAKLRAKELDLFLLQQQQQQLAASCSPQTPDATNTTIMSSTPPLVINTSPLSNCSSSSSSNNNNISLNNCNSTNDTLLNANPFCPTPRRPSALEMLLEESDCNQRDASFDGSANSDEYDDRGFSPNATSAAASMLSMRYSFIFKISFCKKTNTTMFLFSFTANTSNNTQPMMSMNSRNSHHHPLSPTYNNTIPQTAAVSMNESHFNTSQIKLENNNSLSEQAAGNRGGSYFPQRPRRRREMQAISKIVETREYPYSDGFFWKNNGNTIQKKTGNKSVYYKCSNSSKVNPR
jgi:hypothetical protein